MKVNSNNTYNQGTVTVFIYPSPEEKKYVGVCLELDIVETDKDKNVLAEKMRKHVRSYVEYVCTKKLDIDLLNRPAPDEYWKLFFTYLNTLQDLRNLKERKVFKKTPEATVETLQLAPTGA